jgi:MFS family permease
MNSPNSIRPGLAPTQWLICFIASLGFAFDIYELLMGQFVFPPAIAELTGAKPGTPEFGAWVGRLFYIPAVAGGIFGLLGGYLTDRLGRRRVLTWSILVYAISAFLAGFSPNIYVLLVLRCTTFVGVCVEFVAAVAWLAELFSDPHQRERVLGYTQAFSSIGGLLVAIANSVCVAYAASWPAVSLPDWLNFFGGGIKDPHAPWRYTLMSGLVPALPLIVIRPFLPESPTWQKKRAEGTLRRPSFAALFAPELRRTTLVTTLMFALAYGAAFGAIQQVPQMVAGFPQVKAQAEGKSAPEQKKLQQAAAAHYGKVQEVGGLCGRVLLALLVVRIVSRRSLLRVFQGPGLLLLPLVFGVLAVHNSTWFTLPVGAHGVPITGFHFGIFLAGLLTVGQFSFWGNYLPRVYPIHLRGTGESFAANIGGRLIGTSFAWVANTLAVQPWIPGQAAPAKMAYTAAAIGFLVYLGGLIASAWLPEPKRDELPE